MDHEIAVLQVIMFHVGTTPWIALTAVVLDQPNAVRGYIKHAVSSQKIIPCAESQI